MAVDRRNGRHVELQSVAGQRFDPPENLCEKAVAAWEAYWSDPVSSVGTAVDRNLLERWVSNVDRYWRLIREADEQPLTRNSQGQVANPLYAVALKVEASVKADEAQLGIGPKNRAALGIAVLTEKRSLADMNAKYAGEVSRDDDAQPPAEEDPRLAVVKGELA